MTIIAGKNTKAEAVLEMLRTGMTNREIRNRMPVSPSYVSLLKKQMVKKKTKAEPTPEPEPAPVVDKPEQLEKILNKRAEQYGTFMRNADIAIKLKQVIHNAMVREDTQLYPDQLQALDMIVTKIGRILTGNPSHLDSWIDIAGYAKLVSDRLQGNAR
jgi:transposase